MTVAIDRRRNEPLHFISTAFGGGKEFISFGDKCCMIPRAAPISATRQGEHNVQFLERGSARQLVFEKLGSEPENLIFSKLAGHLLGTYRFLLSPGSFLLLVLLEEPS